MQLKNYDIDEDEIDDSNVVHGSTKNNKRSVMPGPAKPPIFPGQRTKAPEEKGKYITLMAPTLKLRISDGYCQIQNVDESMDESTY